MRNRIILLAVGIAFLMIVSGSVLVTNLMRLRVISGSVEQTNELLREIAALEVAMLEAELNERDRVPGGNTRPLPAHRDAANAATLSLQAIETLVAENAKQFQQIRVLRVGIESRLNALAGVTQLAPEGTLQRTPPATPGSIQAALEDMRRAEEALLGERRLRGDRAAFLTAASAASTAFLAMLGAFLGGYQFQRLQTIRELRLANSHIDAILAAAPDAMIAYDDSGRVYSFSATAERMFQLPREEAHGLGITSLFLDSANLASFTASREDSPGMREITARRKDGSVFAATLHVHRMQFDGNVRFLLFIRDLTDRQTREQAETLHSELLHLSRLITMGEMASALAHELNQPLTALVAYVQGARQLVVQAEGERGTTVTEALDLAAGQALKAADVIRRLREFVARGETDIGIESLKTMVQEAFALATFSQKHDQARLTLALDPAVDRVLASKIQIQQVLLNLIRNALEAMRDLPRRELAIASAPASEGMVVVTVADSGSGIAPEVADQVFQSFLTTKKDGLGLGLSISRTIVEAHGGSISAEPNPGGGTVFRFTLRSGQL